MAGYHNFGRPPRVWEDLVRTLPLLVSRCTIPAAHVWLMVEAFEVMQRSGVGILIGLLFLLGVGCKAPFPPQRKEGLPEDHVVNIKGAFHKEGYLHPYRPESGCSSATCHHEDLDGGIAVVNGATRIAPSCFQCHGTKWQDD